MLEFGRFNLTLTLTPEQANVILRALTLTTAIVADDREALTYTRKPEKQARYRELGWVLRDCDLALRTLALANTEEERKRMRNMHEWQPNKVENSGSQSVVPFKGKEN